MKKKDEELTVITKTYDLILWSCNHTGKFPRNHRFVLGERIDRSLYELLETLIQAKYQRERQALLENANLIVEFSAAWQGEATTPASAEADANRPEASRNSRRDAALPALWSGAFISFTP